MNTFESMPNIEAKKLVHVAVGVIQNTDGEICISRRLEGKHLAGLWEFPGGKVEMDESLFSALKRELKEELGLEIASSEPLIEVRFDYPEKSVLLDVHWVRNFAGEAKGLEGQEVIWVNIDELKDYSFPEANCRIIDAIVDA